MTGAWWVPAAAPAPPAPALRIVVDPGTFDCLNLGDVAMLQIAVRRLRLLWPDARMQIFTSDAAALLRHCPGVEPLADGGRRTWLSRQNLLGSLHARMPRPLSVLLGDGRTALRHRSPRLLRGLLRLRLRGHAVARADLERFFEAMSGADLLVLSGAAAFTDSGRAHTFAVLDTVDLALAGGAVLALVGQGVGPINDASLLARMRRTLPGAVLATVREGRMGRRLLGAAGVDDGCIAETGDDAVELAHERRPAGLGSALGVNVRVAGYAGVGDAVVDSLRPMVEAFVTERGIEIVALPIARHSRVSDPASIRRLVSGWRHAEIAGLDADAPGAVIAEAGRCRVVLTGAYHAAVFALSQGVPALGVVGSDYYAEKFAGLADEFGGGCRVVRVDQSGWCERAAAELAQLWADADALRPDLLGAAGRQIERGRRAYQRLPAAMAGAAGRPR